jgi:LuxR family maltose regulon positive regulatory protein
LRELEQANAFVVALDTQRSWFHYHTLFADLLQLELLDTTPHDDLARLHGAAAAWFAEHGFPVEAVRHAQAAQDWCLATRMLSDHWFGLVLDGRAATADELLAGFPAGVIAADAELTALLAARQLDQGSFAEAERNLQLAAAGTASVPAERRGHLQVALAMLRLNLARLRGDVAVVVEEARRLLERDGNLAAAQLGLGEELRAVALLGIGTTELWTARFDEAERHLEQARVVEPSTQAIELARRHGWTDDPLAAGAYMALGAALTGQGRLEEAEPWIERAERTVGEEAQPASGLSLHYVRAELELARGRDQDALAALRAGERLTERLVAPHPLATRLRALLLRTLVRMGATERAEQALAEFDDNERETPEMRVTVAALRLA